MKCDKIKIKIDLYLKCHYSNCLHNGNSYTSQGSIRKFCFEFEWHPLSSIKKHDLVYLIKIVWIYGFYLKDVNFIHFSI